MLIALIIAILLSVKAWAITPTATPTSTPTPTTTATPAGTPTPLPTPVVVPNASTFASPIPIPSSTPGPVPLMITCQDYVTMLPCPIATDGFVQVATGSMAAFAVSTIRPQDSLPATLVFKVNSNDLPAQPVAGGTTAIGALTMDMAGFWYVSVDNAGFLSNMLAIEVK